MLLTPRPPSPFSFAPLALPSPLRSPFPPPPPSYLLDRRLSCVYRLHLLPCGAAVCAILRPASVVSFLVFLFPLFLFFPLSLLFFPLFLFWSLFILFLFYFLFFSSFSYFIKYGFRFALVFFVVVAYSLCIFVFFFFPRVAFSCSIFFFHLFFFFFSLFLLFSTPCCSPRNNVPFSSRSCSKTCSGHELNRTGTNPVR